MLAVIVRGATLKKEFRREWSGGAHTAGIDRFLVHTALPGPLHMYVCVCVYMCQTSRRRVRDAGTVVSLSRNRVAEKVATGTTHRRRGMLRPPQQGSRYHQARP